MAMEPGWGGPGVTKALPHDGGEPGPGEEEQDRRTDEWFVRRLVMLEEIKSNIKLINKSVVQAQGTPTSI